VDHVDRRGRTVRRQQLSVVSGQLTGVDVSSQLRRKSVDDVWRLSHCLLCTPSGTHIMMPLHAWLQRLFLPSLHRHVANTIERSTFRWQCAGFYI